MYLRVRRNFELIRVDIGIHNSAHCMTVHIFYFAFIISLKGGYSNKYLFMTTFGQTDLMYGFRYKFMLARQI